MMHSFKWSILASLLVLAWPASVEARTIEVPIHWTVQKNEISIARLRTVYGPRIRKDICSKLGRGWRKGDTVKVIFYGAGNTVITDFTYTARDCGKS